MEPVWQDIAATDGGELLDVLRRRIEPCALVVQLVGQRYGAEPPQPTAEFGRVSYTQFEALYAERLGRKVIYHFVAPGFPSDPASPEPNELAQMQARYKEKLAAANLLRQEGIALPQDLELSIRRISDELARATAQTERLRTTHFLADRRGAGGRGSSGRIGAVWASAAAQGRHGSGRAFDGDPVQQDQLTAIQNQLLAAVVQKPLATGQTKPDPLPPELIEKAKLLLEQGNAEQQALAKIALKQRPR